MSAPISTQSETTILAAPKTLKPKPVILWCHSRCCSTAVVRAMVQHPMLKVANEPFIQVIQGSQLDNIDSHPGLAIPSPWFNTTRVDIATKLSENKLPEPDAASGTINFGPDDGRIVFIKDMAQYGLRSDVFKRLRELKTRMASGVDDGEAIDDPLSTTPENPTVFPVSLLRKFNHTFLIREPERAIPSFIKSMQETLEAAAPGTEVEGDLSGYIMYLEQRLLYRFFADPKSEFNTLPYDGEEAGYVQQPQPPPLIDASDLLKDPTSVMKQYCEVIDIPFDPTMMSWSNEKPLYVYFTAVP
ncbi:hypothetical protein SISSUDRAFT_1043875 [Sistotremastrum suecicum HHB10207 ss-3]|uniref:Uncharacterized protein n=1 Tax=Sistotremastrum suecicum HHB10207 ss-3 TaxID=1314776 RepID=A0A166FJU2_9AGAM|nr:hypothetical protein SISSUDRAFT_1043875 [Sistotremastrum suecicum HHB10207 ss-3]